MSEQSVTLAPGQVTTISTGMAAGTTIYNGDANNAAWVSGNPTPGPGSGMRIGPKGSLQWTTAGPVYGAVDTGVTSPIVLTASSNVGSLVNPVDVGAAVATQLLNQGVPSVFLGNIIASGTGLPMINTGNYGLTGLDVSKYASVVITVRPLLEAQASVTCTDTGGGNLGSFDFPITAAGGGPTTFVIPVTGPKLNLNLASNAATNSYTVYGSNRPVQGPRIMNGYSQTVQQNFTQAFTAGTPAYLTQTFTSNGKPVYVRMVVTGTGVGKFGYKGFDSSGALIFVDLIDSAGGVTGTDGKETEKMVNLPPGRLQLYFYPNVTATYTAVITLVQEHY